MIKYNIEIQQKVRELFIKGYSSKKICKELNVSDSSIERIIILLGLKVSDIQYHIENLPNEEWKDVGTFENLYQVSNLGRIKVLGRELLRKNGKTIQYWREQLMTPVIQTYHGKEYAVVYLTKERRRKAHSIHRLVAKAFIPNPLNKPQVNHKDGIKINNNVSNLEWATPSENTQHAFNMGLAKPPSKHMEYLERAREACKIPVGKFENDILIESYSSIKEAAEKNKINKKYLSQILLSPRKKSQYDYRKIEKNL